MQRLRGVLIPALPVNAYIVDFVLYWNLVVVVNPAEIYVLQTVVGQREQVVGFGVTEQTSACCYQFVGRIVKIFELKVVFRLSGGICTYAPVLYVFDGFVHRRQIVRKQRRILRVVCVKKL